MSDIIGKAKEQTGKLSGDKDLEREGQSDQAVEKVKDGVEKLADKVKDTLHKD